MTIDATFWVAISFVLFFALLVYFKIPQKINEILSQLISNIKNEIDESEKLRNEAKTLLDNTQTKLDNASNETNKIIDQLQSVLDKNKLSAEVHIVFKVNNVAASCSVPVAYRITVIQFPKLAVILIA